MLVIARHHESEWNKLGKWTGITDVDLSDYGEEMSKKMGLLIKDLPLDQAFLSNQIRTEETLLCMEEGGVCFNIPVIKDEALNERDYGDYTGKNKWEMKELVGEKEFEKIRRGFDYPIPKGETLRMVYERVVPYYLSNILPLLNEGKNVLIVAHGNSLRALMKYLENISDEQMEKVEMPFGAIFIYETDIHGRMVRKDMRSVGSTVNA
jgi:2,3-bisphosphoglycerate-dependent phosphoglycerate mutase